jgi:hypothetical protein
MTPYRGRPCTQGMNLRGSARGDCSTAGGSQYARRRRSSSKRDKPPGRSTNAARVFAEFATNLCRERQMEGIAWVKANAVYVGNGRPASIDTASVREMSATAAVI